MKPMGQGDKGNKTPRTIHDILVTTENHFKKAEAVANLAKTAVVSVLAVISAAQVVHDAFTPQSNTDEADIPPAE